ncbi:hypothetical protein ACVWZ4_005710 [Bradyrhizobium sp. USDA 4472]
MPSSDPGWTNIGRPHDRRRSPQASPARLVALTATCSGQGVGGADIRGAGIKRAS